jgi:DnaJ-class molecular chaperone
MYTIKNTTGNIVIPGYKKIIPQLGLQREEHVGNLIIIFNVEYPEALSEKQVNKLKEIL